MLKLWRADENLLKPVLVECLNGGWPESDPDGEKIFENTHFEDFEQAKKHLLEHCLIGVKWAGDDVLRAESELLKAHERAAKSAKEYVKLLHNLQTDVEQNAAPDQPQP